MEEFKHKIKSRFFVYSFFCVLFSSLLVAQVRIGIDQLERNKFDSLIGRNVAILTNHTGLDSEGNSTVDLLRKIPTLNVVCVLTPEHGFRGTLEHGQAVSDWVDPETGLTIYSLYGNHPRPTDNMLKGVDTIVFDIQDIGTRFYTYITTMGMALQEAAKRKIRFVVLDRPNPIRGDIIEGDILDSDIKRMTGYFPLPVRHGLTVGEIADWMNQTQGLEADLVVVPLKRWKRDMWFEQTGLSFNPPSPNIRSVTQALLYTGVGCFEATNIAVGRGTDSPFEIFGAPWIHGNALCAFLREKNFPGVVFESVEFTPDKDIYANERCEGVRLVVTDRKQIRPFQIFVHAFAYLFETYPGQFKPEWEEVRVVTGSNKLQKAVENRRPMEELLQEYEESLSRFREQIAPFFLY